MSEAAQHAPLWLSEAEVAQLVSLPDAITALEHALTLEASEAAQSMPKTMLQYGASNLHALGAKLGGLVGTKTWAHTQGGTCPLLLLWNADDGQLVAVIEAFALGSLRTGAMSGLATDWMARPDATVMAMFGTGKQALAQVAAVAAVRPLSQVRVFSRNPAARAAFVQRLGEELDLEGLDCDSVASACEGVDIVTTATRASQPFLHAGMLGHGAHVNAVGSIGLDREEFAQDLFDRATCVAVDSMDSVQTLSREFMTRYGSTGSWTDVQPLSRLISARQRRSAGVDLSLFKAMGMGLSDLALGARVLDRARSAGVGRTLARPTKSKPRLRA